MVAVKKESVARMIWRFGCMLPLTPWPIVLYYPTLGDYGYGSHGANALHSIAGQVTTINFAFWMIGMLMVFFCDVPEKRKTVAYVWLACHHFFFLYYILVNAAAYA